MANTIILLLPIRTNVKTIKFTCCGTPPGGLAISLRRRTDMYTCISKRADEETGREEIKTVLSSHRRFSFFNGHRTCNA